MTGASLFNIARLQNWVLMLAAVSVVIASPANAGSVAISSTSLTEGSTQGSFTGTLEYRKHKTDTTIGTLIVTLTNTTASSVGGWMTAFIFDAATSDDNFDARIRPHRPNTHSFNTLTGSGLQISENGRTYDGGAAVGDQFLRGGPIESGIAVGETGVLYLQILAMDAHELDVMDFLVGDQYRLNFLTRFRGMQGSAYAETVAATATILPTPGSLAFGTIGLLIALVGAWMFQRGS